MTRIIALNQGLLQDQSLDCEMLQRLSGPIMNTTAGQLGLIPRAGINNLPFKNDIVQLVSAEMPEYNSSFSKTWADVTDARAVELLDIILKSGRQLAVQWSGGIDSTVIVVAILKNFSVEDRTQVVVACNQASVAEYPEFYSKYIVPNFNVIDIDTVDTRYIQVNGLPADLLLLGTPGLDQCHPGALDFIAKPWRQNSDQLIGYLTRITNSPKFGPWYFEKVAESVESVDVPVESCFDFLWWGGFNYHWVAQLTLDWFGFSSESFLAHQKTFYQWYNTTDYQLWAMVNNRIGVKFGSKPSDFKLEAKKYIHDYNRDDEYFLNKLKTKSISRKRKKLIPPPYAVTDEFKLLYLEQDSELIEELLPSYFR
jgi:predicted nucleic-acid-binding Zn-ribbon protein